MDNIYRLLRLNRIVKSHRIKVAGLLAARLAGIRHLFMRLDPIMACNLRCRMCPFGHPESRKRIKGVFTEAELSRLAEIFFPKIYQLVIGCGYEPTTYKNFMGILDRARDFRVPHVGLITNGQLLSERHLNRFIDLPLAELTFSTHGVRKETYEHFMVKASYERFLHGLDTLKALKRSRRSPWPRLRLNYTVNAQNLEELSGFFEVFGSFGVHTLQIRPMFGDLYPEGRLKETDVARYRRIIADLSGECKKRGIRLMATVEDPAHQEMNYSSVLLPLVYLIANPEQVWREDFDWRKESYDEFCRRNRWSRHLASCLFAKKDTLLKNAERYAGSAKYDFV
jgi:MoaA/NifB/PqqE/SkfB family radical SAM enzyme